MNTFDLGTWKVFDPSHQRKDKWQAPSKHGTCGNN